ncbi:MAG: acyl carrier protein [Caulobacterales bacterium]|nr:acyl carrier protein [Caulobacterales bacterium]
MIDAVAVQGVILTFIRDEVLLEPEAEIAPDANLFTSGTLDSMGIMRLIAHLEALYGFSVPPTDFIPENFRSVDVMAAYCARRAAP